MGGHAVVLLGIISILTSACDSDKIVSTVFTGTSLPETPFADSSLGIANATGVAVHPDGRVFVTHLNGKNDPEIHYDNRQHFFGQILVLQDDDGDGVADRSTVFADSLVTVTSVAFRDDEVYASVYGEVIVL